MVSKNQSMTLLNLGFHGPIKVEIALRQMSYFSLSKRKEKYNYMRFKSAYLDEIESFSVQMYYFV